HFSLRDGGRLCEVRDETAGAGAAQSRTAGLYPDQLASCGAALSVEDQYRDHGILGRGTSGRQQPRPELQKFMGRKLDEQLRRLRQSGFIGATQLYSDCIHTATKSLLLCLAVQRRDARSVQAGSATGDSLV